MLWVRCSVVFAGYAIDITLTDDEYDNYTAQQRKNKSTTA